MRYAVVVDGIVTNVVLWDGESTWQPEGEVVAIPEDSPVGPDWTYDGSGFQRPAITEIGP